MRAVAVLLALPAGAQVDTLRPAVDTPPPPRATVPFAIGEQAVYNLKFGFIHAGTGVSEVLGIDSIRGREAWHTVFRVRGGIPGFRVNDRFESWSDVVSFASLRHWQEIDEGPNERERRFEIFPERGVFQQNDRDPEPTVANPLDDGSFLYFIRTIPLEVGQEYSFDRYFRPDRNPVRIIVLRRERIKVPAGTFNTIVIKPIIKSRGVFAENGRAEVWITDDSHRVIVQIKSSLKIGSLNLYLKSYRHSAPQPDSLAKRAP